MAWLGRSKQKSKASATALPTPGGEGISSPLERRTLEIGRQLLSAAREQRAGVFSARFWSDQLMNWTMKDPAFKIQLFRFIDVFPMLRTPEQVHDYLTDYLGQPGVNLPPGMGLGLSAGGLAKGLMSKTITGRITAMAGNFIAGTDAASALPTLEKLWKNGIAFSVDLLGEACVSDAEAEVYQRRYLDLVETLPVQTARWPAKALLETDYLGPIPRANVSIKISSLCARTDPIDIEGSLSVLQAALRPILETAARHGVLINFDMEQSTLKELTLALFTRCCEAIDFPAGIALQSYLRTGEADAERLIAWAKRTGRQVTVRLIKGAYWDYEVIHAERMGWPVPVWTEKRETDACFERMAERFVAALPRRAGEGGVKLALGSHNIRSIAHCLALLEKHGLPSSALETQKLHGMGDQLEAGLKDYSPLPDQFVVPGKGSGMRAGSSKDNPHPNLLPKGEGTGGLRIREYSPVGEMIPGMAYFVRRLLENTSNQSWLRAGFSDNISDEELLASPHPVREKKAPLEIADRESDARRHALTHAVEGLGNGRPMINEPVRDFSQSPQRGHFQQTVTATKAPAVERTATSEDARAAIARAATAFPAWRDLDPLERANIILKAGGLMRQRRDELSAIMIREAGKTWREADADVCEAIDFCEFYARCSVGLFNLQRLGQFVGELNHQWYQPRGVTSVISPWNFPLAICTGMTTAALSVGNPALVKPSSQTRGIARAMCEILWQAGVPADVLHFLPGAGREIGEILIRDPRVAMIAFTGSKEVGLHILQAAGETPPGQPFVKKVVCEMGGKNAIIVDDSADLDEAVLGVRHSAYGYSGQKCSACSRAIVLEGVFDIFLRRLVESTRTLVIGDPADPGTDVGPVIDESAAAKIREYIEIGKNEGRLELACEVPAGLAEKVGKPYIGPHIFSGIERRHRLANEEIFGPVLSVMKVRSFEEALDLANSTEYKLTGGVFSRKPEHLESARRNFRVGNLYLNRGCTGALVGRQPFGGFGLSGVGSKAGGADYLLHFTEPRCSAENTMRHGFAPGLE